MARPKQIENKGMTSSLIIVPSGKKILTQNQEHFNRLLQEIDRLKKKNDLDKAKLETLLTWFVNHILPLSKENAQRRIELSFLFSELESSIKFSKYQKEDIQSVIVHLLTRAFEVTEPNEEQIALFDRYNDQSYAEIEEDESAMMKDFFAEMVREKFGVDVEIPGPDASPEELEKFQNQLHEAREKQKAEENSSSGKKTKKQREREEKEKNVNELKNLSIRSIYISLVKELHPDGERDPVLKARKEEKMKEASEAYEKSDLLTLLRLQGEIIKNLTEGLATIADERLGLYNLALEEQVRLLQHENWELPANQRYRFVAKVARLNLKAAMRSIHKAHNEERDFNHLITSTISNLRSNPSKKYVIGLIDSYLDELDDTDSEFDFDDF